MRTTALFVLFVLGCASPQAVQPSSRQEVATSTGGETSEASETTYAQPAYVEPAPVEGAQLNPVPEAPDTAPASPRPSEPAATPPSSGATGTNGTSTAIASETTTPSSSTTPASTPSGGTTTPSGSTPAPTAAVVGVVATSANSWTISETVWNEMMSNAMSLARIVPETQGSQTIGFRLQGIRSSTPLAQLGLANGDVIQTVNGVALRSIANALSVTAQRNASDFHVELLRDGAPRVHEYHVIRP